MSWNLIAQIEAGDHVLDALDLKLHRDMDRITTAHPPTRLDVAAVRRELRGLSAVRDLMGSEAGAAALQVVDMRGNPIRSGPDALANYSFFTRLTGGKLPLIEVELPGKLSAFMLARTLQHNGDLLRMDLFGGSHLTPPNTRVFEMLSGAQGSAKRYGRIPAIRLADTVPHAPLMKDVIRKLNPQREDWYRMQRALLEVVPRDHVVEGRSALRCRPTGRRAPRRRSRCVCPPASRSTWSPMTAAALSGSRSRAGFRPWPRRWTNGPAHAGKPSRSRLHRA